MTPEEIKKMLADQLGDFGKEIIERMEAGEEKVQALDATIAEFTSGTGERFKDSWFGRLAAGNPMVAPHGLSVEEVLERGKELHGVQYTMVGGRLVPMLGGLPRGGSPASDTDRNSLLCARMMRVAACAKMDGNDGSYDAMLDIASKEWGDRTLAGIIEETRDMVRDLRGSDATKRADAARGFGMNERALGTAILGSGAALTHPTLAAGIIDFLHPWAVVRSLGAGTLPLTTGQLSMPYLTSAVTASYVGENAGVNESSPGDARLNFNRKILQAITALSMELLRESSYVVDAFLRVHMAAAMGGREDLSFLRGDGTEHTPRGMKYFAEQSTGGGSAHKFDRTLDGGAVTVQTITDDAIKAMRLVEDSKVPQQNLGWAFPVRDAYGLMAKRNSVTSYEVWPEMRAGQFYGNPYKKSPQIPKTNAGDGAGTGTNNKSEVYFAAFAHCIIAEAAGLEINSYPGGAYKDSSGNVVSGISNREVVIEACARHDFGCLYRGDEVVMIDSVDWGA